MEKDALPVLDVFHAARGVSPGLFRRWKLNMKRFYG